MESKLDEPWLREEADDFKQFSVWLLPKFHLSLKVLARWNRNLAGTSVMMRGS